MVSAIIPTYNRANVITKAVQSILNQTYVGLEVIVVSDGFCDATKKVINGFADKRLSYYEIAHSARPAVPRNFGIKKARGEFIAFCDDDDQWLPDKLTLQIAEMSQDESLGLVYTKCLIKEGAKERVIPNKDGRQGFIFKDLFLSACFIATSTVLIRKDVIKQVGAFDESIYLKAVEDYDLWLRIARLYKIGFVNKVLAIHTESKESLTRGIFMKIRRQHLVPCKFYRENYISLRLFIEKLLRIFCKSITMVLHL